MPLNAKKMFHPDWVVDLEGQSKAEVLEEMVDAVADADQVTDREDLLARLLEREKTLSTGVGIGLAVPHVKIPSIRDFIVAVGRHREGVEFDAIDGQPVHIVVMIGCNDTQSGDYLKVMSQVVRALRDEAFREKVLTEQSHEKVVDLFIGEGGIF